MSVSKAQAIDALLGREQSAVDKAQFHQQLVRNIIEALPPDSPAPVSITDSGYCADATLVFKGCGDQLLELLKLYPPLECIDLDEGSSKTQKPEKYLRDSERRGAIVPIYPALLTVPSGLQPRARWWSTIAGLDAEIHVEGPSLFQLSEHLAETHTADSHSYRSGCTNYFPRKLAEAAVQPAALSRWMADWDKFTQDQALTVTQKFFCKAVRQALAANPRGVPVDFKEDAASALRVFHDTTWTDAQKFEVTFPDEHLVARLVAFVQGQIARLPQAHQLQASQFETVKTWLAAFFAERGRFKDRDGEILRRILHKLHHDTNLDVRIRRIRGNPDGTVSVLAYFTDVEDYPEWVFATNGSSWPIRPQDIEVEYVAM